MYQIIRKDTLSPGVQQMVVKAPLVARKAKPGEFIILRVDEQGERIPLTIADFDAVAETITIIFQEVGAGTKALGRLQAGESILDFVGPLGNPTHVEKKTGTVICVGGGIGVAPIFPIARGMKEAGNKVISIVGARNHDLLILEKEMKSASTELRITTDDGSYERKGFVTDVLKELIEKGEPIAEVIAIGPVVMMRAVAELTRPYGIKTIASLNPIMVDGTGMCGGCRVSIGDKTKFACVDGPEFDAHLIDFAGLMARQKTYVDMEKNCEAHTCRKEGGCTCH
ncbi:MAG TPA: sulfide/dihydroorotate dehydrogenase-like FAD/NAD-binding protein [Negativicutes bacterium]|nr:sulfide/dihydroorotate dehydrogenase-like FAD/NAD-binding protein [Negativicutes bacterium]